MPYLAPRRNPLLSDVSSVGPSSSATSSATPAATAAPESPAYQDLRAYLGANAPQAKEIAGRILSPIAETAEGAATELGTNMTEEQRTAKNAAREDAAAKLAGTGNAGFWGEKLEGIGGGTYSPGQRNMDEYLLTAAGADASARALRDQYAHRLGTYSAPRPISSAPAEGSPFGYQPPTPQNPGGSYQGQPYGVPLNGGASIGVPTLPVNPSNIEFEGYHWDPVKGYTPDTPEWKREQQKKMDDAVKEVLKNPWKRIGF